MHLMRQPERPNGVVLLPAALLLLAASLACKQIGAVPEPSLSASLAGARTVERPVTDVPVVWRRFTCEGFSFCGPSDLEKRPIMIGDSFAGRFENAEFRVDFDYGWYLESGSWLDDRSRHVPSTPPRSPSFRGEYELSGELIDGRFGMVSTWHDHSDPAGDRFGCGVHVWDIHRRMKEGMWREMLSFTLAFKDGEQMDAARRILRSIRFDEP